jgi:lipopolysaccharide export LptBFGC system permease protein LptF
MSSPVSSPDTTGATPPEPTEKVTSLRSVEAQEITESRSSIPSGEAIFRRKLHLYLTFVLIAATAVFTAMAAYLIFQTARSGQPDAQRLAFGLIGTILGILWSQFTKLLDTATKR